MIRCNSRFFVLDKRSKYSPYGKDKYRQSYYIITIFNAATNNDTFLPWYTHVRALYRVWCDRDHLWRYHRSRFKKADGLPSYTSFLSKHARCRNRQRSRILRSCRPHESAGCYISKAAEYMSLSSSPENTLHFILFIWILFWIYFFQTTHRLFYLTVTRKLIIGKYKYCERFAECNSSKNFVSL